MSVTAGQLLAEISHRLGGSATHGMTLVNLAGRHLFSMHSWRSAERVSATASYVAGQDYVVLASNIAELLAIEQTDWLGGWVTLIGSGEMLSVRQAATSSTGGVLASLESTGTGWQLSLWPTPTGISADVLSYVYRAGWAELSNDTDVAVVMPYQESLLRQLVREFAAGWEVGELEVRLASVRAGEIFRAAALADGKIQRRLGPMSGGALSPTRLRSPWDAIAAAEMPS